jgi:prepilin-type N-terminal cleavage/methylation domain-containing protein
MRPYSAFTLIELLVVVAIIAILAAIAVPNFLEAQIRSKVSRTKADQRTLTTAIETYSVDNNKYPIRRDRWDTDGTGAGIAPPFREKIYDPDPGQETAAVGMHVLTTPIAYITTLPRDIFDTPARALAQPGTPFSDAIDYWDPLQLDRLLEGLTSRPGRPLQIGRGKGYVLISVGPDQRIGLLGTSFGYPPDSAQTQMTVRYIYDASNGTVSTGNVYRFSGDLQQSDFFF